jgi:hypothetical protein
MGHRLLPSRDRWMAWAGVLAISLIALDSVFRFIVAVYGVSLDDAYIFFVYARNVATGQGWSFNAGETSFGTSSVLWTLLLALPALFGIDLVQASRVLGASCVWHPAVSYPSSSGNWCKTEPSRC